MATGRSAASTGRTRSIPSRMLSGPSPRLLRRGPTLSSGPRDDRDRCRARRRRDGELIDDRGKGVGASHDHLELDPVERVGGCDGHIMLLRPSPNWRPEYDVPVREPRSWSLRCGAPRGCRAVPPLPDRPGLDGIGRARIEAGDRRGSRHGRPGAKGRRALPMSPLVARCSGDRSDLHPDAGRARRGYGERWLRRRGPEGARAASR